VDSFTLGGYTGGMAGAFALRGGGAWAWNDIDTSRAVIFPGFYERQKASYNADTGQIFGEIAYPMTAWGVALEPFAGLAYVSVDTGTFKERGGSLASLRGRDTDQDVGYSTLGLRAASTMHLGAMLVTPHISAAWQHAFDDVTPGAALAFATTGIPRRCQFPSKGSPGPNRHWPKLRSLASRRAYQPRIMRQGCSR